MHKNKKNNYENTESPYELLKAAQRDIFTIKSIIKDEDVQFDDKVETICRCATESAEKMLKCWIISSDENVKIYGMHDLGKLYNIIVNMNSSFSEMKDKLINLNNYSPKLRYSSPFSIEKHEVKECLKNLKYIYDFILIKEVREKINKDRNFIKLPDNINILFGEFGQGSSDAK